MRRSAAVPAIAMVSLALVGLAMTGCGGGGGGGGEPGVGGSFRVVTADALPNGSLLPATPSPSSENQYLRIEFSKSVDPGTLFDPTTANGMASALRLINHFYLGAFTEQAPPGYQDPQSKRRLQGFLVWNGQTNFDLATGTFRPQLQPIAPQQLGIDLANYEIATNIIYFVADTDANPLTPESFLPSELTSATLQASQIQVDCQKGIRSLRGESLSEVFGASFNVGTRDWILPIIDIVEPAPNQTDVNVTSSIVIRFTEPVEGSTVVVAPPTGQLPPGTNLLVEALVTGPNGPQSLRIAGTTSPATSSTFDIMFTPQTDFPGNTVIKVTITPGSGNYLDLANNDLAESSVTDGNYSFTTGPGPQVANNPVPPMVVHFITQNSQIGSIDTNAYDDQKGQFEDFYFPIDEQKNLRYPYPGGLLDIDIGPFIAPYFRVPGASGVNVIGNPPLQTQYLNLGLIQGNAPKPLQNPPPDIHLWTPPGTESDFGFCQLFQPFAPPVQPLGNFLFVSNEEKDVVHVINSNTFQHYKDMPTPDPRGLALNPLLSLLFVTNFGGGSVSMLDLSADPVTFLPKGTIIATIPTGLGPDSIVVDPDGESIYVVNRLENSASVIQMNKINSNEPIRVKVTGNVGPACVDVCATGRIPPVLPPWFQNFPSYAYFCNLGADNISVFESGPQQINGYGRDNIIQVVGGFPSPTSVNSDEMSAATAQSHEPIPPSSSLTGCWATCGDGTVKHLRAKRFKYSNFPNPPPAFIGVDYEIQTTIRTGERPQDVVIRDPFLPCQTNNNKHAPDLPASGAAQAPARIYVVNGDGTVSVIELSNGREVLRLPGIGVRKLAAYYTN